MLHFLICFVRQGRIFLPFLSARYCSLRVNYQFICGSHNIVHKTTCFGADFVLQFYRTTEHYTVFLPPVTEAAVQC